MGGVARLCVLRGAVVLKVRGNCVFSPLTLSRVVVQTHCSHLPTQRTHCQHAESYQPQATLCSRWACRYEQSDAFGPYLSRYS